MECTEVRAGMRDWALGAPMPARARLHVDSCAVCDLAWRQEHELTDALAGLRAQAREAAPSSAVKAAVLSALPGPVVAQRPRHWRPLLVLAAALLLSIAAGWYLHQGKPSKQQARQAAAAAVYTDFFPLSTVTLDQQESAQLVRIKLPRREMRRFGLPVSEEWERSLIEADVLIGQDGVARAVRFVSGSH